MKIFTSLQLKELDEQTIQGQHIHSLELMERAASRCSNWIEAFHPEKNKVFHYTIFCGTGNNGGDGMAIARLLNDKKLNVSVYYINVGRTSEDFTANLLRLNNSGIIIHEIKDESDFPAQQTNQIVIDALLGAGTRRPLEGILKSLVKRINQLNATVISIDLPSGLPAEISDETHLTEVIQADYTLTFHTPKLSMLTPETGKYCGEIHILDIGLDAKAAEKINSPWFLLEKSDIQLLLKTREKFSAKWNYGHTLVMAGSKDKPGAAVLTSRAAMRSGSGLVTLHSIPNFFQAIVASSPEIMLSADPDESEISTVPDLKKYSSIAVGPGMGVSAITFKTLKSLIHQAKVPLVFDADAINILAENKTWLEFIPAGCIFTPHTREFDRLTGENKSGTQRFRKMKEFSERYQCYVVLKGTYTAISTPSGKIFFNSTGNPGMASGGTGDVLTGMIAGLTARGYTPFEAAVVGVYLHGLAGDMAAREKGMEALMASDIIENIGKSFLHITA